MKSITKINGIYQQKMNNKERFVHVIGIKYIRLLALLSIIIFTKGSLAQTTDEYGFIHFQMKSSTLSFNCIEDPKMGTVLYSNSLYNENEIRKEYPICEVPYSYQKVYGTRVDIDNKFVDAFVNTFGQKRIGKLAKENETIKIGFFVDLNNTILMIYYRINKNSSITPDELACLEKHLIELVKFKVEWNDEKPCFDIISIETNFLEIESGTIPRIIRHNKLVDRDLEQIKRSIGNYDSQDTGVSPIDKESLEEIKRKLTK